MTLYDTYDTRHTCHTASYMSYMSYMSYELSYMSYEIQKKFKKTNVMHVIQIKMSYESMSYKTLIVIQRSHKTPQNHSGGHSTRPHTILLYPTGLRDKISVNIALKNAEGHDTMHYMCTPSTQHPAPITHHPALSPPPHNHTHHSALPPPPHTHISLSAHHQPHITSLTSPASHHSHTPPVSHL
jgi:hypothetical protein